MKRRVLALCLSVALCLPVLPAPAKGAGDGGEKNLFSGFYDQLTSRARAYYRMLDSLTPAGVAACPRDEQGRYVVKLSMTGEAEAVLDGSREGDRFVRDDTGSNTRSFLSDWYSAWYYLRADKPEVCVWLNRYSFRYSVELLPQENGGKITELELHIVLPNGGSEAGMYETMMAGARDIAREADREKDTYSKLKKAYDILLENNTYGRGGDGEPITIEEDYLTHTAYSALVFGDEHDPVCSGYASAYQIICRMMGIPCITFHNATHSWNFVQMDDGKWYHADLTWSDNRWDRTGIPNYDYFLVGTESLIDGIPFDEAGYPDHVEDNWLDDLELVPGSGLTLQKMEFPEQYSQSYQYLGFDRVGDYRQGGGLYTDSFEGFRAQLDQLGQWFFDLQDEIGADRILSGEKSGGTWRVSLAGSGLEGVLLACTGPEGVERWDLGDGTTAAVLRSFYTARALLAADHPEKTWVRDGELVLETEEAGTGKRRITGAWLEYRLSYGGQEKELYDSTMAAVEALAGRCGEEEDTYGKLKALHDLLMENNRAGAVSGTGRGPEQEAFSALIWGDGYEPSREGYAAAFKVVCDQLGIPCVVMAGANGAWNCVQMEDGCWYHVDVWGDDRLAEAGGEGETFFLVGNDVVIEGGRFRELRDYGVRSLTSGEEPLPGLWLSRSRYPAVSREGYHREGETRIPVVVTSGILPREEGGTAYESNVTVMVDGKPVSFKMYRLSEGGKDTNYVRLIDLAYVFNGTDARFRVSYDPESKMISLNSGEDHLQVETAMKVPFSGAQKYEKRTQVTMVNGVELELQAFALWGGGYTYYQLRDLGQALGFNVGYDVDSGALYIQTDREYDPGN